MIKVNKSVAVTVPSYCVHSERNADVQPGSVAAFGRRRQEAKQRSEHDRARHLRHRHAGVERIGEGLDQQVPRTAARELRRGVHPGICTRICTATFVLIKL